MAQQFYGNLVYNWPGPHLENEIDGFPNNREPHAAWWQGQVTRRVLGRDIHSPQLQRRDNQNHGDHKGSEVRSEEITDAKQHSIHHAGKIQKISINCNNLQSWCIYIDVRNNKHRKYRGEQYERPTDQKKPKRKNNRIRMNTRQSVANIDNLALNHYADSIYNCKDMMTIFTTKMSVEFSHNWSWNQYREVNI